MKLINTVTVALVLLSGIARGQQPQPHTLLPYQDPKLPAERRITDLLQRMTIEEKLAMLGTDPTVPRLGIVGTNHVEGLHGLALGGPGGWGGRGLVTPTTQFPQSRGLGQT